MKGNGGQRQDQPSDLAPATDVAEVFDTAYTDVEPLAAGMGGIDVTSSGSGQALHGSIACREQQRTQAIDDKVQDGGRPCCLTAVALVQYFRSEGRRRSRYRYRERDDIDEEHDHRDHRGRSHQPAVSAMIPPAFRAGLIGRSMIQGCIDPARRELGGGQAQISVPLHLAVGKPYVAGSPVWTAID